MFAWAQIWKNSDAAATHLLSVVAGQDQQMVNPANDHALVVAYLKSPLHTAPHPPSSPLLSYMPHKPQS